MTKGPKSDRPYDADFAAIQGTWLAATTTTEPVVLYGTDVLTIAAGDALSVEDQTAITWGAGAVDVGIVNAGLISSSNSYVLANEAEATGRFTFDNAATGVVEGQIEFNDLGVGAVVAFNNHGLMRASIDLQDTGDGVTTTITNFAEGIMRSADAGGSVMRVGEDAVVYNAGQIRSDDDTIENGQPVAYGGDAINYNQNSGALIHNFAGGLIEGSRHGITGNRGVTIVNDAGGLIVGRNGSAINVDNDGSLERAVHVTNYGTLQGRSANYDDSDGDAIDADGLLFLENYGLIQGLGAAGFHNGGINTSEGLAIGGGVIHNAASGVIYSVQRAIQVDDSDEGAALGATQIINEGRIESADGRAINIVGSYADTLTNRGTIIGSVLMGGGADVVNVWAGSSFSTAIDTGAGVDTIRLNGRGTNTFVGAVNAEDLIVAGGTWAIATGTFKQVVLAAGTGLTTALNATGSAAIDVGTNATLDTGDGAAVLLSGPLVGAEIANAGTIRGIASDGDAAPLSGTLTIYNAEAGTIAGLAGTAGIELDADLAGGSLLIDNAGTITGADAPGEFALNLRDVIGGTVTLDNSGTITTQADKDVVRAAENMTIHNTGVIQSMNDDVANGITGGDGIDFQSNGGGVIDNHGFIGGSRHGITGERGLTIYNATSKYIVGNNGAALNIDNDATAAETVTIVNYGNMFGQSAQRAGTDSDGDGIDVDGLIKLDNYGLVGGYFATGRHDGEINIAEGLAIGGGVVNNYGTISSSQRAIQVDDSHNGAAFAALVLTNSGSIVANELRVAGEIDVAINIVGSFGDTIVNTGKIDGRVLTGGGDDVVTVLDGGTITGAVSLGAGNDVIEGGSGANVLDGGRGTDTASYAHAATAVQVDLRIDGAQGTGGGGTDTLTSFESLVGSVFGDRLSGSASVNTLDGGAGDDRLSGGDGRDRLIGGEGHDRLSGGLGADIFVLRSVDEIGTGTRHDVVLDFDRAERDRIDVREIDANSAVAGDQAFKFVGTRAFSGAGGEIHVVQSGGNTVIEGDVNGDGAADFQLFLQGPVDVKAADFML